MSRSIIHECIARNSSCSRQSRRREALHQMRRISKTQLSKIQKSLLKCAEKRTAREYAVGCLLCYTQFTILQPLRSKCCFQFIQKTQMCFRIKRSTTQVYMLLWSCSNTWSKCERIAIFRICYSCYFLSSCLLLYDKG